MGISGYIRVWDGFAVYELALLQQFKWDFDCVCAITMLYAVPFPPFYV